MARYRRRHRWTTRELVEDSVVLRATDFLPFCRGEDAKREAKYRGQTGTIEIFGLRVAYAIPEDRSKIALLYRGSMNLPESQIVQVQLLLQPGFYRAKFVCPRCEKTCNSIMNPPRGGRFACRICHNLTYESAQKAHRLDKLWAKFLADKEFKVNQHQGALLWGISEILGTIPDDKSHDSSES